MRPCTGAKRHGICRNLVGIWAAKAEAGEFDDDLAAASILQEYEARIGALERLVGKRARERVSKGGFAARSPADKRDYIRHCRPRGPSIAEGCRLMGLARSTYYDEPGGQSIAEARLIERIKEICAEWPSYGYRRVTAELQATGCRVNHKKVMRLMNEHGLAVRPRRRYVTTTDSDHEGPIFPNLAKDVMPMGPNELWVADITYIAIAVGFVYLAAILDAWSRRVVGYAIGRRVDARLALTALKAAIAVRQPPPDCIHHSDRGSQYAAEDYRSELENGTRSDRGENTWPRIIFLECPDGHRPSRSHGIVLVSVERVLVARAELIDGFRAAFHLIAMRLARTRWAHDAYDRFRDRFDLGCSAVGN